MTCPRDARIIETMNAHSARSALLALALVTGLTPSASATELADDLAARRARVMERLEPETMLILLSAPTRTYSRDVDYVYRQDSNLYYLTGITQPDTILVLMPGNQEHRELLFIEDEDVVREHWSGQLLSHAEATARSGIATVLSRSRFESFLASLLTSTPVRPLSRDSTKRFLQALSQGHARIALAPEARTLGDPLLPVLELADRIQQRFFGFQFIDVTPILVDLRLVKTPYEQQLLATSLEIASEAQKAGMRAARPGTFEYEVKAAVEAVHTARGAISWSFPSIVGSGPNATILHNPSSDRRLQAGDLMLVDAAANYEYMSGDLTRTYPVSGTFTAEQREIYELVLRAQEAAIEEAHEGSTLQQLHDRVVAVLKDGLVKLGLITDATGDQYRMWFTHGACHFIGIDVHDVGSLDRELQPGMTFVIEPGLYIRQETLDNLSPSPDNEKLVEKIQPAVNKYLNLGVRIEDAFLLERSGLRHLTSEAPRSVAEIEAFLKR